MSSTVGLFELEALTDLMNGPVKSTGSKAQQLKLARLKRVLRRVPEVVVKISSSAKASGRVWAHLTYITRNGDLVGENERGDQISGLEDVRDVFNEWGIHSDEGERARAKTVHIVMSMPEGTPEKCVLAAARSFARDRFADNHQYMLVLHDDTAQPHVHLAVKAQGFDRRWVQRKKADLQSWREEFAARLREQGVEAEATPRAARAVINRSKSQPMHHLEKDPQKAKTSRVIQSRVNQAMREAMSEVAQPGVSPVEPDAAMKAIESRSSTRAKYAEASLALRKTQHGREGVTSDLIEDFLKGLPVDGKTQAMRLRDQSKEAIRKLVREREQGRGADGHDRE